MMLPVSVHHIFSFILFIGIVVNAVMFFIHRGKELRVKENIPWGWMNIILVISLFIMLHFLVLYLSRDFLSHLGFQVALWRIFFDLIAEAGCILFLLYIVKIKLNCAWSELGFCHLDELKDYGWSLIYYFALVPWLILAALLTSAISKYFNLELESQAIYQILTLEWSTIQFILICLFVIVFAPLIEEIFFRAFLYPLMKKTFGFRIALMLNALIFAMMHASLYAFLPVFIIGVFLILVYEKTGNIFSSVLLHSICNSMSVIMLGFIRCAS